MIEKSVEWIKHKEINVVEKTKIEKHIDFQASNFWYATNTTFGGIRGGWTHKCDCSHKNSLYYSKNP
jgi:hypothetical protein